MKFFRGFTLIEFMLVIGITSILLLALVDTSIKMLDLQRKIKGKQEGIGAVRALLDTLAVEVQSGTAFSANCDSGCNEFAFSTRVRPDLPPRRIDYVFDSTNKRILRAEQKTFGPCKELTGNPDDPYPSPEPFPSLDCYVSLTPSSVIVENATFYVHNKADGLQPLVSIALDLWSDVGGQTERYRLSESFSPRYTQSAGSLPPVDTTAPQVTITAPSSASSITLNASSVTVSGSAVDFVGVQEMSWSNIGTGQSGTPVFTPIGGTNVTWSISNMTLKPGGRNLITVDASDAEQNRGFDTIEIISTAPIPAPVFSVAPRCSGSQELIRTSWTREWDYLYHIFRCKGAGCTPNFSNPLYTSSGTIYDNGDLDDGELYRFWMQAESADTGQKSTRSGPKEATAPIDCTSIPPPPPNTPNNNNPAPSADFTLSSDKSLLRIGVTGQSASTQISRPVKITVSPSGGFNSTVRLSAGGGPPGFNSSFLPDNNVTVGEYGTGANFRAIIPDNTTPGNYGVTITGKSGTISHSIGITLQVVPAGFGEQ